MKLFSGITFLLAFASSICSAQYSYKAVVKEEESGKKLTGVIVADKNGHGAATNDSGFVLVTGLSEGIDTFTVSFIGYKTKTVVVHLPDPGEHVILLDADESEMEDVIVVASIRTNDRIENSPVKVEVLGAEEMAEENAIKPANIASILGDISGVQMQQSDAISGNTNVRIQGLNGKYTQILRDGMPLYEGFSGGFGVLQVPPMDLRQIELIKGSSSTLYGGGAIAGLVNLISKRPTETLEGIFTVNATTLQEQNVNAYVAKRNEDFGFTIFAGYNHQNAVDVNSDGLSDVPQLNTFMVHPRLFWYPNAKTTLIVGYSGAFEKRMGGDLQVINHFPDSIHKFYEKDVTNRNTGELIFERTLGEEVKLTVKGSASSFNRTIETNTDLVKGNQLNYYGEASVLIPHKRNNLVAGINVTGDNFKKLPGSDSIALNNFGNSTIGAFAQYSWHLFESSTIEAGIRGDHTNLWGDAVLPRIALFHRFNSTWAVRAGAGLGYKTPNALEPQTIDYPIKDIQELPGGIKSEKSVGYNLEGNFKKQLDEGAKIFVNQAFFYTEITDPIISNRLPNGQVLFGNASGTVTTMGFDTYVKMTVKKTEIYIGYTYTDAERKYLRDNQFMPLTPQNRFAFTAVREFAEKWRIGLEGSWVGQQTRDGDNNTPSWFFSAVMIERKFGKIITAVLNVENLFDYRQTRQEQIYTGSISNPEFKPLWAPIDGRVINLSFRFTPFKK